MSTFFSLKSAALAAALALGATAVSAAAPATLGDRLASGQLSEQAFVQLISGTGLTPEEARGLTLQDVVRIKWTDD